MSNIKKSEIFWNIVATILIFSTVLISPKVLLIIQCVMMFLFVVIGFINVGECDKDRIPFPLFLWITPIGITLLFAYLLIELIILVYNFPIKWILNNPIKKFNTWLDTEKEKRMKFKEFTKEETKYNEHR